MSGPTEIRSGRVEHFVGDAYYPLQLRIGELRLLSAKLNLGPTAILDRLQSGQWFVDEIIEPVRFGLIGGGMTQQAAHDLTRDYITDGHVLEYLPTAINVILASLIGHQEDRPDLGEPQAPVTEPTTLDN